RAAPLAWRLAGARPEASLEREATMQNTSLAGPKKCYTPEGAVRTLESGADPHIELVRLKLDDEAARAVAAAGGSRRTLGHLALPGVRCGTVRGLKAFSGGVFKWPALETLTVEGDLWVGLNKNEEGVQRLVAAVAKSPSVSSLHLRTCDGLTAASADALAK